MTLSRHTSHIICLIKVGVVIIISNMSSVAKLKKYRSHVWRCRCILISKNKKSTIVSLKFLHLDQRWQNLKLTRQLNLLKQSCTSEAKVVTLVSQNVESTLSILLLKEPELESMPQKMEQGLVNIFHSCGKEKSQKPFEEWIIFIDSFSVYSSNFVLASNYRYAVILISWW